ncbi:hypothetical protein H1S01_13490 [Heliobacterium chlorum]|uniref:Uncharacterized protein n=1 Tax=Heliobacterium chlorum TaxID=2698 RepID=A0ABR7T6D0_HELCL|nr:hypothetical protein [Heliobacterium chlorum]
MLVTNDGQQIKAYWKEKLVAHIVVADGILSYQGVCRMNILPHENFVQLCLDDMEDVLSQLNA